MESSANTIDVLNDLVKINNDRVAGFENAISKLENDGQGIAEVFNKLAYESRDNVAELSALTTQYGGEAEEGTSASGTLHRAWIDIKATFSGNDVESILNECERGEDAIKAAYRSALEDNTDLPYDVIQTISDQQQGIIAGHDLVKSLRDQSSDADDAAENTDRPSEGSFTGSITDDEWKNKDGDFEPYASPTVNQNGFAGGDKMNPAEFELANEVNATPVTYSSPDPANENTERPVDVGEYQSINSGIDNYASQTDISAGAADNGEHNPGSDDVYGQTNTGDYQPVNTNSDDAELNDDFTSEETEEEVVEPGNSKLQEFFVNELKDLLWAEEKLVDTLPKMAEAATSSELKEAFENHLSQTEEHVERLKEIFGLLGLEPDTTTCDAMDGIVDEGESIIDDTEEGTAQRDVGLIFAGQKAEHYEIASYGGMVSLAKTLGYNEAATILSLTLNEEKEADALLTVIAENNVNYEASNEPKEEEGFFS